MNPRTEALRRRSLDTPPSISAERALLLTRFYRENDGRWSVPGDARPLLPRPLREEDDPPGRGRADRRRARPGPQGGAHLPGAHLPQRRGPAHPRLAPEDELRGGAGGDRGLRAGGDPLLARPLPARPALRRHSPRSGTPSTRPASSPSSWSSGRPGTPSSTTRSTGAASSTSRPTSRPPSRPSTTARTPRPGRSARSSSRWTSPATRVLLFAARHADAGPARRRGRDGPRAPRRAAEDRRRVRAGPRPRPARLPRGAPVVLVLPPRGHHRAQRLGLLQPRPPRPAPAALLRARARRRLADPRGRAGAPRVLLREVQQPPGPAQGRGHRGGERDLHRLREHQPRRAARRRLRRLERALAPPARRHRRDAPPAALLEPAALAQDARRRPEARAARRPEGLRLPVALQRRRGGRGAAAAGQDARGRAGRRLLRLRRGGGLRQGGLRPHRLLQPAEGAGARAPRRRRPAHGPRGSARPRARRRPSPRSTPSSPPSRRRCATSST